MKGLLLFALPILFGNLFQQMYNAVDPPVVGNFVSGAALAAVTSTSNVTFLMVGFPQSVFIGAGVAVLRRAGREKRFAIHTTVAFALIAGAALPAVGAAFSPWLLEKMNTPPEVLPSSMACFRIYYGGLLSAVLYNCAMGIMRAVGAGRRPPVYLVLSSVVNILPDLLFVVCFCRGRASRSRRWLPQSLSAGVRVLAADASRRDRAGRRRVRCDPAVPKLILRPGIPAGMQNSTVAFANICVRSCPNTFGAAAVAGSGTFSRIEGFASIAITGPAPAITTYVSRNIGAGVRVSYPAVMLPFSHDIRHIFAVFPLTWALSTVALPGYYRRIRWKSA